MHIEGISVATVQKRISCCWGLKPFIKDGDKEPSWDGNIYVYNNDEGKKDGARRVPVQVKGKKRNIKQANDFLNHQVYISDIRNYLNDGGVIYFVVAVYDDQTEQIFYKSLLPYDLENILNKTDTATKTKTIKFLKLPDSAKDIRKIFLSFINDKDLQASKKIWTPEKAMEAFKKGNANEVFYLQTESMDMCSISREITKQSFYLYAKTPEGFHIPFGNTENCTVVMMTREKMELPIFIDNVKHYNCFYHGYENGKYYIYIGNALKIPFNIEKKKIENGKINFRLAGTLTQRLKDSNFMVSLLEHKEIHINNSKCFTLGEISLRDTNLLKNTNLLLNKTKYALEYFGVSVDLNLDKVTEKDCNSINALINASEGNEICFKNNQPDIFYYIQDK